MYSHEDRQLGIAPAGIAAAAPVVGGAIKAVGNFFSGLFGGGDKKKKAAAAAAAAEAERARLAKIQADTVRRAEEARSQNQRLLIGAGAVVAVAAVLALTSRGKR